jgi:hypothetical protein
MARFSNLEIASGFHFKNVSPFQMYERVIFIRHLYQVNQKWTASSAQLKERARGTYLSLAYQPRHPGSPKRGESTRLEFAYRRLFCYLRSSTSQQTTHPANSTFSQLDIRRPNHAQLRISSEPSPWRIPTKVTFNPLPDLLKANKPSRAQHQRQTGKPQPPAGHVLLLQSTLPNRNGLHLLSNAQQPECDPHTHRNCSCRAPPPRPILDSPPEL